MPSLSCWSASLTALKHGVGAYGKNEVIGPAEWPHYDLIIVARGGVRFSVCDREIECVAGSALLLPPKYHFVGFSHDCGCIIWVQHFRYDSRRANAGKSCFPSAPVLWQGCATQDWPRSLMHRITALHRDAANSSAPTIPYLLALLLDEIGRPRPESGVIDLGTRKILDLQEWVRGQPHPLPSIVAIAGRTGWSVSQFRYLFQKTTGQTIGSYLRELRIQEGKRLLGESCLSIKEISFCLGYSDPVCFHRAFVSQTGVTPLRFRTEAPRFV